MRFLALLFLIVFCLQANAQYKRKPRPIFPKQPQYRGSFYSFTPGATYTIPWFNNNSFRQNGIPDTSILSEFSPNGRIGAHFSVSKYHFTEKLYFFKYLDYGLGYSGYRGRERVNTRLLDGETELSSSTAENTFGMHQVQVFLQFHRVDQFSDKLFLQNSIGVDGGFDFIQNFNEQPHALSSRNVQPNQIRAALNYRVGLGIKANSELVVIPSLEFPILFLYPFSEFRGDFTVFQSRYHPITFKLQFLLFRKSKARDCPPVDALGLPEGMSPDGQ